MMLYRVVKYFTDMQDCDHPYNPGDIFPRDGVSVSEKRIAELAGSDNRQGVPLIKAEESQKKTRKSANKTAKE